LVTAGASGMGRSGSEAFAREGAHVIVVDLDEQAAKDTVAGIEAAGGSAEHAAVDGRDQPGRRSPDREVNPPVRRRPGPRAGAGPS
ncbi:MAG TPA: SDR family NAD(P)-dependent oxidoreductase, partial [Nocardioides sp.]